jgi:hypothetical protein
MSYGTSECTDSLSPTARKPLCTNVLGLCGTDAQGAEKEGCHLIAENHSVLTMAHTGGFQERKSASATV